MIKVCSVRPSHGGGGTYECSVETSAYPEMDTITEYISSVLETNQQVDFIKEGDEEHEVVESADGAIYGQGRGKVIGWRIIETDQVELELVYEF